MLAPYLRETHGVTITRILLLQTTVSDHKGLVMGHLSVANQHPHSAVPSFLDVETPPHEKKATLQRKGGHPRNASKLEPGCTVRPAPGTSVPLVRFSRWPKNIFFASDYIARKVAAPVTAKAPACTVQYGATYSKGQTAPRRARSAEATGRHSSRKTVRQNHVVSRASRTPAVLPRGGRRLFQTVQEDHDGGENGDGSSGSASAPQGRDATVFLEQSASALLLLHTRFFRGVHKEEDLACRLCTLCREAGWMGNPRRLCPELDPFVLDKLLAARFGGKERPERKARRHNSARRITPDGAISFEDFYRILADIAALVYPHDAREENRARSGRAMHKLLSEGVLPLAADTEPRVWSPRWVKK